MSKLEDAAVRLHYQREREQVNRFFEGFGKIQDGATYEEAKFENTNHAEIWFWAIKRWPDFHIRDYKYRQKMRINK